MITFKLGEIRNIVDGLNQIMLKDLPIKTAYAFGKLGLEVQKEFEVYEKGRRKLLERYCAKDKEGKPIIEEGNYQIADHDGFGQDFNDLANIEVKIDFKLVKLAELGDIQVSPAVMAGLYRFIEE